MNFLPKLFFLLFLTATIFSSCGKTESCIDPGQYNPNISCPPFYNPVCGCDDVQYQNDCEAERNGVRHWISGPC